MWVLVTISVIVACYNVGLYCYARRRRRLDYEEWKRDMDRAKRERR